MRLALCQSALKDKMPAPTLSPKKGRTENIAVAGEGTWTVIRNPKSRLGNMNSVALESTMNK